MRPPSTRSSSRPRATRPSGPWPSTGWRPLRRPMPSGSTTRRVSRASSVRMEMGGTSVDFEAYRAIAGWDDTRQRVDVRLWNPGLAAADPGLRMRAGFLFLDNLLGEDAVERWVGEIDVLEAPVEGRTPEELRAEIERRAAEATGESWTLAQRQRRCPDQGERGGQADRPPVSIDEPGRDRRPRDGAAERSRPSSRSWTTRRTGWWRPWRPPMACLHRPHHRAPAPADPVHVRRRGSSQGRRRRLVRRGASVRAEGHGQVRSGMVVSAGVRPLMRSGPRVDGRATVWERTPAPTSREEGATWEH